MGMRGWFAKYGSSILAAVAMLVSVAAVMRSCEANRIARAVLELQQHQAELAKETVIQIDAKMRFHKVHVSPFRRYPVADPTRDTSRHVSWRHGGLDFFIQVKIYNASEHPVSIDEVRLVQITDRGFFSWTIILENFHSDLSTHIEFPLLLGAQDMLLTFIQFTPPMTKDLMERFQALTPDSLYTAKQIVEEYSTKHHVVGFSNEKWSQEISLSGIYNREFLACSPGEADGFRYANVVVVLGSGEFFSKRVQL